MSREDLRVWFAIMAFLALLVILLMDPSDDFGFVQSFPGSPPL
jgi:hypothetical protein